jgi:hypothetical protein
MKIVLLNVPFLDRGQSERNVSFLFMRVARVMPVIFDRYFI